MRYIILLIVSGFFTGIYGQNSKHVLFGLDMDLDWYSLTNYSALSYAMADSDKSTSYVVTDCDYYLDKVDIEIEKLGFDEYLIAFNKGVPASGPDLERLQPFMYIGRYKYSNLASFKSSAFNKANFLKNKLIAIYGNPDLKIEKSEFRVYKWVIDDFTIIVNAVQKELTTSLNYMVNSR